MESPQDVSAHRSAPDRRLSRRSLLARSGAVTLVAAAGLLTACTADNENENASPAPNDDASRDLTARHENASRGPTARHENPPLGRVLFGDVFAGHSLSRNHWNPYICDNNSDGRPWLTQPSVAVDSSAIGPGTGNNATYDLPSAIRVNDGLTLMTYRGTKAVGYSWTGSVICSRPTSNNFGSGTVHTAGFTFTDARVEVRAKMPDLTSGQWPSIWFLPAWDGSGAEIDLFEGGFLDKTINPNQLMSVNMPGSHNQQQLVDCGTDLSAGYHTYAMEYRQGSSVEFFFDGSSVHTYTRNVPIGDYFIILSNGIASARAFRWHTQVSNSTPAINLMQVSYVRAWAV
jgi:Glycosyl hydrolases family 16